MHQVAIYTTSDCQFCRELRGFLAERGIPFFEHNVGEDASKLAEMRTLTRGSSTVPVVVLDGGTEHQKVLIGYESNVLESMLSSSISSSSFTP
jgi:glutaredoxin